MIKKFYQITIRDYNQVEQSGEISHLKTCKLIPVWILKRKILKELEKANQLLNVEKQDDDELLWKVQSLAKINAIQANVLGLFNLLNLGTTVSIFKDELKRYYRRKIKMTDKNIQTYIDNLQYLTGLKIVTLGDLSNVVTELEYRKDKFNENFNQQNKKEAGKVYLMQIVLGVFSYLNQPVNLEMTLSEFAIIRNEATEKMKREKTK